MPGRLFVQAFLPQFADPARGPVGPQLMLLGLVFSAATMLVFGMLSILAAGAGDRLRRSETAQNVINRIAGAVFAALAVKLILTER